MAGWLLARTHHSPVHPSKRKNWETDEQVIRMTNKTPKTKAPKSALGGFAHLIQGPLQISLFKWFATKLHSWNFAKKYPPALAFKVLSRVDSLQPHLKIKIVGNVATICYQDQLHICLVNSRLICFFFSFQLVCSNVPWGIQGSCGENVLVRGIPTEKWRVISVSCAWYRFVGNFSFSFVSVNIVQKNFCLSVVASTLAVPCFSPCKRKQCGESKKFQIL